MAQDVIFNGTIEELSTPQGRESLAACSGGCIVSWIIYCCWFGVREKHCSRLEIYDRLRASEQAVWSWAVVRMCGAHRFVSLGNRVVVVLT